MVRLHFVAIFVCYFGLQWILTEGNSGSQVYAGKCKDMEPVVILNLSNMSFSKISDYLIDSPHVSCLSLSNNDISDVSDKAFDLLPNLLYLDVSNNQISKEALFCVGARCNITTLVLDNNRRQTHHTYYNLEYDEEYDDRDRDERSYDLEKRRLYCNFGYSNLKHIYARNCDLYSNEIPPLDAPLTHVYLSSNNIDSLDFMDRLPSSLTHLYLDRNNIVSSRNLRGLKHVVHLDLSFNGITNLCHKYCSGPGISFGGATSLQCLSLVGNNIRDIDSGAFDDQYNLTVLDLSNNTIVGFKKGTFDSLSLLQNLSLSDNSLLAVPELYPLWSLIHLNLSFNSIETISSIRIAQNASLQSIDLSHNKISSIENDTFSNFTSIIYLDLSENELYTLSNNWVASLPNLEILHIGRNHIENIADLYLSGATALTDVFLEVNLITLKADDLLNISRNVSLHLTTQHCTCGLV